MITKEELYKDILEAEASLGKKWTPEKPGDLIIGSLVSLEMDEKTVHGPTMHIKIKTDWIISNGEELENGVYSVWGKAHLRTLIEELPHKPFRGDGFQIKYCGEVQMPSGGKKMKTFVVKHNPARPSERHDERVDVDPFAEALKPEVKKVVGERAKEDEVPFLSDKNLPTLEGGGLLSD